MSEQMGLAVKRINKLEGEGTAKTFCDVAVGGSFLIRVKCRLPGGEKPIKGRSSLLGKTALLDFGAVGWSGVTGKPPLAQRALAVH